MKKIIFLFAGVFALTLNAQENKTWRLGASLGMNGNHARFSGGMPDANARFVQNDFGSGALDFIARYDYNKHWMAQFSLGIGSTGYEFALAENYSLINESRKFSTIQSDFGKVEIPAMLFYKFNPNCKNSKWLVGGGFVFTSIESKNVSTSFNEANEGNLNSNYLTSTASSNGGAYLLLRWSVALEKVYKRGSILNAAFIINVGLDNKMTSATVKYTVDNQSYEHNYTSNGSFVGFRVSYFLRPLGTRK